LQDLRIRALKNQTGKEITPADANFTFTDILTKEKLAKHKLDIGNIDKVATLMLLTENAVNLLPKEVKKKVSEFVDIKYLQYGVEGVLGLAAACVGDMLAGIIDIAEYGIGFRTNSEESKLEDMQENAQEHTTYLLPPIEELDLLLLM